MDEKGEKMEKVPSVFTLNSGHFNTSSSLGLTANEIQQNNSGGKLPKIELYDPFQYRDKAHSTSDSGALIHMVKSSLGSGILAMPSGFVHSGLILGIFGTILIGSLCTYCVNVLVQCSQKLSSRVKSPCLSFADTAEVAFQTGPAFLQPYAGIAKGFVRLALFCAYYFGVTVYVVLIATSFQQVVEDQTDFRMNVRLYILLVGIPLIPLGIIRTLKYLVPFTTVATILITFGLGITLYFTFIDLPPLSSRPFVVSPMQWPLFLSTVLFSMEGIGTVLPIENSMEHPQNFLGCPGVLNIAMTIIVLLYGSVGFFGYLKYGDETQGSITLNLDANSMLAESVKILVALSVLLTYGLQFCVPSEIIWDAAGDRFKKWFPSGGYHIMRGLLIVGTIIVAVIIPNLSPIISLVGAICFSMLGLFCPSVIELATRYDEGYGAFKWILIKDVLIIALSIFALISGTYASLLEIIDAYAS